MVLVTASTRSGRASCFLMVRRIGCAVCRQPEPVGLGSTRRMPNHLRKIRTCHGLEDRLRGITPQTPGGPHTPTRTSPLSHADHPRHTLLGSWDDGSVPVTTPAGPKTRAIADQNTTVELPIQRGSTASYGRERCLPRVSIEPLQEKWPYSPRQTESSMHSVWTPVCGQPRSPHHS